MITQTGLRSCRRGRERLFRIAIGAMILSAIGCAELETGTQADKAIDRATEQPPAPPVSPPVSPGRARQDSIDPSMHPDPKAFHSADLALWDGAQTLPGSWIAHPMALTARRVRLTNDETGAQVDAAMLRREPNLSGPRIIVSSEAAARLGLMPGLGTRITIEGLAYGAEAAADSEAVVASAAEEPVPAPIEGLADKGLAEPVEPAPEPVAALTPAAPEDLQPVASLPAPRPTAVPDAPAPAPEAAGDITDGRNFIQAGVFGQPEDAARLAAKLRAADLLVTELPMTVGAEQLTRVLIGPYRTIAERDSALETVRNLGPADAAPAKG